MNYTSIDWEEIKNIVIRKERLAPENGASSSKDRIVKELTSLIDTAGKLADAKSVSLRLAVTSCAKNEINLEKRLRFRGSALSANINGAYSVRLFLVTIGDKIEKEASRLMREGESLHGYLIDRIGSVAVENLAQNFEAATRREQKLNDLSVSARFSPGYCDWPIEDQIIMEKALEFSKLKVSLNKNFMMTPKKSISGLVAIGPKDLFSVRRSYCSMCPRSDCSWRER